MQKVLVVDRDSNFVRMAQQALGDFCEVSVASTRVEALGKTGRKSPDMVILGYLEPRGDAFRLHKELRENPETNRIPILVVDVRPEEHLRKGWRREEGMQMDAKDYVSRPIKPAELKELVGEILERTAPKPVELEGVWQQVEGVLKQMDKIEKMLVK
jgi:DNA-binding response OmpR family regulator